MGLMEDIASKVQASERIDDAEALALFRSPYLPELGNLADQVNRQKNGDKVFYNVNRHINPTNVCALSCKFCSFSRKPNEDQAFALSIDEVVSRARNAVAEGATEVHMVGGLHPRWQYSYYVDMIRAVHEALPDLHIKAFTAVELDWLARKGRKTLVEVLTDLVDAGLGSIPGGGAEIFHPDVRDQICATKVSGDQWIATHKLAHEMGLRSNCTMLYGHIESHYHRVDHMRRLRELQDETGGFNAFIPLAFQPFDNDMGIDRYTSGYDDLKTLAIARLYLDNFANIKAYWVVLGQDIAQIALQFGANDFDGTVVDEKISKMAGSHSGIGMAVESLKQRIRLAQKEPQERDTLYRPIHRDAAARSLRGLGQLVADGEGDAKWGVLEKLTRHEPIDGWDYDVLLRSMTLHELARYQSHGYFEGQRPVSLSPVISVGGALWLGHDPNLHVRQLVQSTNPLVAPLSVLLDLGAAMSQGRALNPHALLREAERWHDETALPIVLRGMPELFTCAGNDWDTLGETLAQLRHKGVQVFEEGAGSEDADPKTIEMIHQLSHDLDLPTIPTAYVASVFTQKSVAPWAAALDEIARLKLVRQRFGRQVPGYLAVEVLPGDGDLTSYEFLRLLAVVRTLLPRTTEVITPWQRLPAIGARQNVLKLEHDPRMKILPLCGHFGATDIGVFDPTAVDGRFLIQALSEAGLTVELRNARFTKLPMESAAITAASSPPMASPPWLPSLPALATGVTH